MVDNLSIELEEKMDRLNGHYQDGEIPSVFGQHLRVLNTIASNLCKEVEERSSGDYPLGKLKEALLKTSILADILLERVESDFTEFEEVLENIGHDFFRRLNEPGHHPLVLSKESDSAQCAPVLELEEYRYGKKIEKRTEIPTVIVPQDWESKPLLWPLITHEYSHALHDDSDSVDNPHPSNRFATEYFADRLAAEVLGPTYLLSLLKRFENEQNPNTGDKTHPAESNRINVLLKDLKTGVSDRYFSILDRMVDDWRTKTGARFDIQDTPPLRKSQQHIEDFLDSRTVRTHEDYWLHTANSENSPIGDPIDCLHDLMEDHLIGQEVQIENVKEPIIEWEMGG